MVSLDQSSLALGVTHAQQERKMGMLKSIQRKFRRLLSHGVFGRLARSQPEGSGRLCEYGHSVFSGNDLCRFGHHAT